MSVLGEGVYSMSSVKEIKVTEGFHLLSEDKKQCQAFESFEDCITTQLMETMKKNCGCIPFELQNFTFSSEFVGLKTKVMLILFDMFSG